jgi:threonine dehydrogenase-like Zn-dependent dehydrogenase
MVKASCTLGSVRALVLAEKPACVSDFPEPQPASGETIVEVRQAGVCDTDLQLVAGYMDYRGVLGHEFVGAVDGRRVVADINAGCGTCEDCRQRDGHHCASRTVLGILGRHGAFAERLIVPTRALVEVPDSVPDDHAVFAEPLAAALHVLDELPADLSTPVTVIGDGKLGLLITLALRSQGIETELVGHHRDKLSLAEAVGAKTRLESECESLPASQMVIEASGSASGFGRALRLVRPRGTLVLKTTIAGSPPLDLAPIVINELRVVGSRCGDMARAVRVLADHEVDPSPLIAARYRLADGVNALGRAGQRGVLKVLIDV